MSVTGTRIGALQMLTEFRCDQCGNTWAELDHAIPELSPGPTTEPKSETS